MGEEGSCKAHRLSDLEAGLSTSGATSDAAYLVGYARVSTLEQDSALPEDADQTRNRAHDPSSARLPERSARYTTNPGG